MYAVHTETTPFAESSISLAGPCGYTIENDRIIITIAEIANQRDLGDLSGTLAVELWALDRPYEGGNFSGNALCGTSIGELRGQHVLTNCRYDLIFQAPPAGNWFLTLMLREWTASGYLTRNYVNFSLPYVVERKPTIVRGEASNVISVEFAGNRAAPAKPAEPKTTTPLAAAPEAPENVPSAPPPDRATSLNTASYQEIAAVKGISKKVAENIVAARPFTSLDELLRVKGMGAKLLKKVRQFFKL